MTTGHRTSAVVRWALGAVLVLAVLGMHALLSPAPASSADHGSASASAQLTVVHDHAAAAPTTTGAVDATPAASCTDDCGGHGLHSLAHLCLAVLVGAVGLLVARLLHTAHPVDLRSTPARVLLAVADVRAPPWTRPTLARLSVLRV